MKNENNALNGKSTPMHNAATRFLSIRERTTTPLVHLFRMSHLDDTIHYSLIERQNADKILELVQLEFTLQFFNLYRRFIPEIENQAKTIKQKMIVYGSIKSTLEAEKAIIPVDEAIRKMGTRNGELILYISEYDLDEAMEIMEILTNAQLLHRYAKYLPQRFSQLENAEENFDSLL